MNTTDRKNFDYQAYTRENQPDLKKIRRGTDARKQRFETAKMKVAVRIDKDIFEEFREIDPHNYEELINQALKEWVSARNEDNYTTDEAVF